MVPGENHQGLIALMTQKPILDLPDLIAEAEKAGENPVLAALDGITDSGNLGAVIRSAEGFGVFGIILPKDRSASVDAKVFKASSGAAEHLSVCRVVNLARALSDLKKHGYWVIGLDASAKRPCTDLWRDRKMVLVLGGEEKGIRPLIRSECDDLVSIPMRGKVNSLNVSAAAAVIFYQISKGSDPA
jgi:23S rRNA (guanosine2251-2'-O)-methyltransferase